MKINFRKIFEVVTDNKDSSLKKKVAVLAEKPDVARHYAKALGCVFKGTFYENDKYIIMWTIGHLFELKSPEEYDEVYKTWSIDLLPIFPEKFEIRIRSEKRKKQFEIIKGIIDREDVSSIYVGTDAGREGELLARWILKAAGNSKPVYRVWINSLTDAAIKEAFKEVKPISNYDSMYAAAEIRAKIDSLIGINFSRAYTCKFGDNTTIAIGRCMTPLLSVIVERDKLIEEFKGKIFYELSCDFGKYSGKYIENGSIRVDSKEKVLKIQHDIEDQCGKIEKLDKKQIEKESPLLFNMTDLLRECNKKYDYPGKQTLEILQDLYEKYKLVSYPRTSSRYLTDKAALEIPKIILNLNFGKFSKFTIDLKLNKLNRIINNDKVEDHHALIPNNVNVEDTYKILSEEEKNVLDEIIFRMFEALSDSYIYERIDLITRIKKYEFKSEFSKVIQKGWKIIYDNTENCNIDLYIGKEVKAERTIVMPKKTQPPGRYTDDSLLDVMENPGKLLAADKMYKKHFKGIGTEATRVSLIEELIQRNYVKRNGKALISTELGRKIISVIEVDQLKDFALTAEIEYLLDQIFQGEVKEHQVLKKIQDIIVDGVEKIKIQEAEIKITKDKILGICPFCHKGKVRKVNGGYGCTEYAHGCSFYVSDLFAGAAISYKDVDDLIKFGYSGWIQFRGKYGPFKGRISLDKKNKKVGIYK